MTRLRIRSVEAGKQPKWSLVEVDKDGRPENEFSTDYANAISVAAWVASNYGDDFNLHLVAEACSDALATGRVTFVDSAKRSWTTKKKATRKKVTLKSVARKLRGKEEPREDT